MKMSYSFRDAKEHKNNIRIKGFSGAKCQFKGHCVHLTLSPLYLSFKLTRKMVEFMLGTGRFYLKVLIICR